MAPQVGLEPTPHRRDFLNQELGHAPALGLRVARVLNAVGIGQVLGGAIFFGINGQKLSTGTIVARVIGRYLDRAHFDFAISQGRQNSSGALQRIELVAGRLANFPRPLYVFSG